MELVVVGAGIAGLAAADHLSHLGHRVIVVDKAKGVGGRMATRRVGDRVFDHGAQFFTMRSPAFKALVERFSAAVKPWGEGFCDEHGALPEALRYPRYCGTHGMTSLPKALAAGLDVRLGEAVQRVEADGQNHWQVVLASGQRLRADGVLITCPVPQALALLAEGAAPETLGYLSAMRYEPCFALMATLQEEAGPSFVLPPPGGVKPRRGELAFIADNQQKGVSPRPALTFHATAAFSQQHFEAEPAAVTALMLRAGAPWLQERTVTATTLHRWRYATPLPLPSSPLAQKPFAAEHGLVFAGDAFAQGRVEGALTSGLAAAAYFDQRSRL